MANFYKDNEDIQFLLQHIDLSEVSDLTEDGFKFAAEFDNAPKDADEAAENYLMVLDSVGELSGDFIAPRGEHIDRQGTTHLEDGTVKLADGIVAVSYKYVVADPYKAKAKLEQNVACNKTDNSKIMDDEFKSLEADFELKGDGDYLHLDGIVIKQDLFKKCEKMVNNEEWDTLNTWMKDANTLHDIL